MIMAEALEEIGDAYAIYGFSGHGREQVEFYRVKSFDEALTATVKGRIGGIEPKRSTRMGTALRHAVEKMRGVSRALASTSSCSATASRRTSTTARTGAATSTASATRRWRCARPRPPASRPFCITVDKAGHDYLREMCDESRYMVIDDITALPRELPKIYQRVVRA